MGTMYIQNHNGDASVRWDPKNEAEVAAAREDFNELVATGKHFAYRAEGEGVNTLIREFDPDAETIVVHRQLAGG